MSILELVKQNQEFEKNIKQKLLDFDLHRVLHIVDCINHVSN